MDINLMMEKISFEGVSKEDCIELRCRDDCPCHCEFSPINDGLLPSQENFE